MRPHAPPEGSARVEAHGTGNWVVDRVSVDRVRSKSGSGVDRVGSKPGSAVDRVGSKSGSGQNPGRPLTRSGQNPGRSLIGSGSDRVRDDVSMMSASDNLNRLTGSKNGSGQNRFDRIGHVTGSSLRQHDVSKPVGFRSGACPSRAVLLNARGGA